jgi:ABC-type transporter Mla subunit MlaD
MMSYVHKESIMQTQLAKQQLPQIDQHVRNAAQLCQTSDNVPDALRECIGELERETGEAAAMVTNEQDDQRILDCVDHLEELGDRAMQACRQAGNLDTQVQKAVQTAHGAISELKHRLH